MHKLIQKAFLKSLYIKLICEEQSIHSIHTVSLNVSKTAVIVEQQFVENLAEQVKRFVKVISL